MEIYKDYNGEDIKGTKSLAELIHFNGQERMARSLALANRLVAQEELAQMTRADVCEVIERHYTVVECDSGEERIVLVDNKNINEYEKRKEKLNELKIYIDR